MRFLKVETSHVFGDPSETKRRKFESPDVAPSYFCALLEHFRIYYIESLFV